MSSSSLAPALGAGSAPPLARWKAHLSGLAILAVVAALWWITIENRVRANSGSEFDSRTVHVFLAITLAGRFAGLALETLFYRVWWTSGGARFRFAFSYLVLAGLSLCDAWTMTLHDLARGSEGAARVAFALLAGQATGSEIGAAAAANGLAAAFGGVGLLTAARVAGTVWLQAHETRRPWALALAVTGTAWLAFRLLTWWTFDLMRGASPS